ncbi:hypothetical protein ACWC4D_23890 [Streptomyces sp. NPDC001288]|uniref:hypothetical protein n=1 Tax=Streptomyces sp. NPDC001297 TaxID=3364559 RepID=UPI003681EF36
MSTQRRDADRALVYPEPPGSSLWHRRGPRVRPLTDAQRRRNRELLDTAADPAGTRVRGPGGAGLPSGTETAPGRHV